MECQCKESTIFSQLREKRIKEIKNEINWLMLGTVMSWGYNYIPEEAVLLVTQWKKNVKYTLPFLSLILTALFSLDFI